MLVTDKWCNRTVNGGAGRHGSSEPVASETLGSRAGIALMQAARTLAAFHGRDYAVPDDVVQIALPSLRHHVSLTAEAEVEGHKIDMLLTELIRSVEVPRL